MAPIFLLRYQETYKLSLILALQEYKICEVLILVKPLYAPVFLASGSQTFASQHTYMMTVFMKIV
jgi:hypothetical protein